MSYSYDLSTNIGKIRNLIDDTTEASALLTNEEIASFLSMRANDLYQTAALCLLKIAASQSLLAKKKKAGNYSEDLTAIAKNLRDQAAMYNEMASEIPADAQAEEITTDFSYREIERNKRLRNETD